MIIFSVLFNDAWHFLSGLKYFLKWKLGTERKKSGIENGKLVFFIISTYNFKLLLNFSGINIEKQAANYYIIWHFLHICVLKLNRIIKNEPILHREIWVIKKLHLEAIKIIWCGHRINFSYRAFKLNKYLISAS